MLLSREEEKGIIVEDPFVYECLRDTSLCQIQAKLLCHGQQLCEVYHSQNSFCYACIVTLKV